MVVAPSYNFDIGIKNYKKNRVIMDSIHLKNEIIYKMDNLGKTQFEISAVSYFSGVYGKTDDFSEMMLRFKMNSFNKPFNFFINDAGNVFTDAEMGEETYYSNNNDPIKIIFCLFSRRKNLTNDGRATSIYSYNELKTFTRCIKTFYDTAENVSFENIVVDNKLDNFTNLGFDFKSFSEERLRV